MRQSCSFRSWGCAGAPRRAMYSGDAQKTRSTPTRRRAIRLDDAKSAMYTVGGYEDTSEYAFGQGSGEAVPLEEYDFGPYNR